jgi:hypothetical protein
MDPPEDICLTFYLGNQNEGITRTPEGFKCVLTKEAYSNMIELISSFGLHAIESKGFEWLNESSKLPLLISLDDKWSYEPQESSI